MKQEISDIEQWELDQEFPIQEKKKPESRFLKTKAVLLSNDPENNPEIEVSKDWEGGLSFKYTVDEEFVSEEIVECDLGHKHRKILTKPRTYQWMDISKVDAKKLAAWIRMVL